MVTDQQKKPDQVEDGGPSTAEAEKKVQDDDKPKDKEPEVQVVTTQATTESNSDAGISETPMMQW